jgi:NAD(P)-dependent dehydrogenase (short-subunit alcohol dehydrogenase family)
MELSGKAAFVTGGSGDIGGAIARALAKAGVDVAVSYVGDAQRANASTDAVRKMGTRALAVQLDQRDPNSVAASVGKVVAEFGRLDILVNNAGWNIGIPFKDLDALTAEIWDRVMETNLRGPYLLARAFAPELRRHKAGRIVNIASLAGIAPGGSSIAYASSKAGLIHLTHCLAVALAPDVTVNCVAPGLVEGTRMAERVPEDTKRHAKAQAVLGRTASAQDIAEQAVAFCRADTVTGQVLVVDGGMPAGMR